MSMECKKIMIIIIIKHFQFNGLLPMIWEDKENKIYYVDNSMSLFALSSGKKYSRNSESAIYKF